MPNIDQVLKGVIHVSRATTIFFGLISVWGMIGLAMIWGVKFGAGLVP